MLIRSQNKMALVNLDQIDTIVYDDENKVIFAYNPGNIPMELGDYSDEENVIKVLDMIQEKYLDANGYSYAYNTVFQMPEEDEIE